MKDRPWHAALSAAFPVVFLLSHNLGKTNYRDAMLPLAALLIASFVLYWVLRRIMDSSIKAGVAATLFWIIFSIYGHVFERIQWSQLGSFVWGRHRYLVPLVACAYLLIFRLLKRTTKDLSALNAFLNIFYIVLFIGPIVTMVSYSLTGEQSHALKNGSGVVADANAPDIYYLIFDGYAHPDTLRDIYHFDNSPFINFLKERGFYVPPFAHSNYAMTSLSLTSSLNMDFLDHVKPLKEIDAHPEILGKLIANNNALVFLKEHGYKFIHFSSGWFITDRNKNADIDYQFGKNNEFLMLFVQTTLLRVVDKFVLLNDSRDRILKNFAQLEKVAPMPGPKFIFAHFVLPHPPYIFGPDGGPAVGEVKLKMAGDVWYQKDRYIDQVRFTNTKIETMVDALIKNSKRPPVILLQADHGSASTFDQPGFGTWENPSTANLQERMRIFSAYYLPPDKNKFLYPSITPVNSFRVLFNTYFGSNYPLLPDLSFYSNYDETKWLDFKDVTSEVRFADEHART